MSTIFEAKLGRTADNAELPNYQGALADGPTDNFVVCFHRDGSPASRFGDLVWDFTAYHPEGRTLRFYFAYWGDTIATEEQLCLSRAVRRVIFALIWHRTGAPLSLGTLANYLTVLCTTAGHAQEMNLSLGALLGDADLLPGYAAANFSGWMCETLGSLLGVLASIEQEALGFAVVPTKAITAIKVHAKDYRAGIKQHSPMPARIYSAFIAGLQQEFAAWLGVSEELLKLFEVCGSNPLWGRSHYQQRHNIAKKVGVDLANFEFCPVFDDLCSQSVASYMIGRGKRLDVKGLSSIITDAQLVCKLIIQTFTGMRDDEVGSLPYHCVETTVMHGTAHYVIKGKTTKFNHGLPKRAQWVTNREGQQAVEAAHAIADIIYRVHNTVPKIDFEKRSKHPLFPSAGYLNLGTGAMAPHDGQFVPVRFEFRPNSTLPSRLFLTIEEGDLRELEQIDPHRAWRSENAFRIGNQWGFKTHQLRRSLALYAQRSGLVSLPSLRRQLQHITEEMSRYYARGSAFAKDFIGGEKDHFGLEWQATQPEAAALGYILNVLMSDDALIGGHGHWVQHRLRGADGTVLIDREATMRRFKKGEMAYKETFLGGCTNIQECDQVAINWLNVDCLRDNCKNLVCNLTKLERVVAAQERLVAAIDPQSIEYRTETADLAVLRGVLKEARARTVGESQ